MRTRHITTTFIVVVLGISFLGVNATSGQSTSRSQPIDDEDQRVATENSRRVLGRLIAQGKSANQVEAELVFLEPQSPDEMRALVQEHHLQVKQLKARFPGLDQQLSAGYVVQPGQTLDEAVAKFVSYQEPYMVEMIGQLESLLDDPGLTPEERRARERQIADMYAFHQSLRADGVAMSGIQVRGTARALLQIMDRASDRAVVAISSSEAN